MPEVSDHEIAIAICCGEQCRSDTAHCHAFDHRNEARRVRQLLDRHERRGKWSAVTATVAAGQEQIPPDPATGGDALEN